VNPNSLERTRPGLLVDQGVGKNHGAVGRPANVAPNPPCPAGNRWSRAQRRPIGSC
jgi:hypothetical protein